MFCRTLRILHCKHAPCVRRAFCSLPSAVPRRHPLQYKTRLPGTTQCGKYGDLLPDMRVTCLRHLSLHWNGNIWPLALDTPSRGGTGLLISIQSRLLHASNALSKAQDKLSMKNASLRNYLISMIERVEKGGDLRNFQPLLASECTALAELARGYFIQEEELGDLHDMVAEYEGAEQEMVTMARMDIEELRDQMAATEAELLALLTPPQHADHCDVILEVKSCAGGQEAMHFAQEVFDMYTAYCGRRGWCVTVTTCDASAQGGVMKAAAVVSGDDVYSWLKFEAGVHRVQRVPATESKGRIHTSTVAVAVLPMASEVEVNIKPSDLQVTAVRASGAGGQHVNVTNSAVRIVHLPTGAVVECQETRSNQVNRERALARLRAQLFQEQLDQQLAEERSCRAEQVGSGARSEKIRTYNYQQGRVTDHRLAGNISDVLKFLTGGDQLDTLLSGLREEAARDRVIDMLSSYGGSDVRR